MAFLNSQVSTSFLREHLERHLERLTLSIRPTPNAYLAAGPSRKELSVWIRDLPEKDKNELLTTAVVEQGERWRNDFMRRFRRTDLQQPSDVPCASERRKVGNLLAATHARAKERARLLNEQRIAEAAK